MDETTAPAPIKKRISDRTELENLRLELEEHYAKIARYKKNADIAAAKGDISAARDHMTMADLHESMTAHKVEKYQKCEAESKIMSSLPTLPENAIPRDVPFSQLTENQRHALSMDNTVQMLRKKIDQEGEEGKYSVELALMHSFAKSRDNAIKESLGWKQHGGVYYPPFFQKDASKPSLLKRLFG